MNAVRHSRAKENPDQRTGRGLNLVLVEIQPRHPALPGWLAFA